MTKIQKNNAKECWKVLKNIEEQTKTCGVKSFWIFFLLQIDDQNKNNNESNIKE